MRGYRVPGHSTKRDSLVGGHLCCRRTRALVCSWNSSRLKASAAVSLWCGASTLLWENASIHRRRACNWYPILLIGLSDSHHWRKLYLRILHPNVAVWLRRALEIRIGWHLEVSRDGAHISHGSIHCSLRHALLLLVYMKPLGCKFGHLFRGQIRMSPLDLVLDACYCGDHTIREMTRLTHPR